jgi:purine-binding chemotaxis protein CheW
MKNAIAYAPAPVMAADAAEESVRSLLRMAVSDEFLAVPIEEVREILQATRLTPLPRTPAFVRGVMNLRGAVVPVIDLAVRLSRPPTVVGRRSCVVVVECEQPPNESGDSAPGPLVLGLLVDAVIEVFDCNAAEVEPAPVIGTRIAADYLQGMARASGTLIGVLALGRLLNAQDLASAIAAFQPH